MQPNFLNKIENPKLRNTIIIGGAVLGVIVAVVGTVYAIKGIKKLIKKVETEKAKKRIEEQANKLSYSESEYSQMADTIERAVKGTLFNPTDEQAIYDVLRKMNTDADLLKLHSAYGIRFDDEDLYDSIRNDFSDSEINKANKILETKNITIRI
jgi:predicted PurR-regulated permease PerM